MTDARSWWGRAKVARRFNLVNLVNLPSKSASREKEIF